MANSSPKKTRESPALKSGFKLESLSREVIAPSSSTNDKSIPSPALEEPAKSKAVTAAEALVLYEDLLTPFEKSEIPRYNTIYYVGSIRVRNLADKVNRDGFYRVQTGEQIAFRYCVNKIIDAGAFGQVCMCHDIKNNVDVALKISKNKKAEVENAAVEAKLLKKILGNDPDRHGIVKMLECFPFRHHFVIVFEFLDKNLYKYIKQPGFKSFDRLLLKSVARQCLNALEHLR
jgi:hypothetical protein